MDAQQVASKLGIRLHSLNLSEKFKENIVDNFIESYEEGVTPNPCVRCNEYIKMGGFWENAKKLGVEYIATGHYARIMREDGKPVTIAQAADQRKDQTYFLYRLNQDTVSHTLFPLADYTKGQIKEIAAKQGFITAKKKESQELCFLANNSLMEFLKRHSSVSGGDIINIETQEKLGEHEGLQTYTIGQRKGIGLHGGPWYVVKKNMRKNILYVTNDVQHKLLQFDAITLIDSNWITDELPALPKKVQARIRYNQPLKPATLFIEDDKVKLKFDEPRKAITPGQSCVIYDGDILLGGGIIEANQTLEK
jgi:tRNA-specific 2-thiouridylase